MQVGDDRGDRELPLKAQCQIGHDADHDKGQRLGTVAGEFIADRGTDELGARKLDRLVARGRDAGWSADLFTLWRGVGLGDHSAVFALAQRGEDQRRNIGLLDLRTHRQTNQHVARGTEVLYLHLTKSELVDRGTGLLQVGDLGVLDLHHRAAGELDRQMQATADQEEHSQRKSDERDDVEHQRVPHERNVAVNPEKFHFVLPSGASGLGDGFVVGEVSAGQGRALGPPDLADRHRSQSLLAAVPKVDQTAREHH